MSLLFTMVTTDLPEAILKGNTTCINNMVLTSPSPQEVQDAISDLMKWEGSNKLQLNKEKTEIMVFRKGSKAVTRKVRAHQGNWQPQFPRIVISLS
jgi:hypothetical protein